MRQFRSTFFLALASATLAQLGWSQQGSIPAYPVDGPVQAIHLDLATGQVTPGAAGAETPVPSCFSNSAFAGFYAVPTAGTEWIDWGVKSCGLSGAVCEIVLGYGTKALDPSAGGPGATVEVTLYSGTLGSCDAKVPVANYVFTGLSGSADGVAIAAFSLTVDLAADGFLLADGPIGWGYKATDGLTGPLLVTAPDASVGTADAFDIYSPDGAGSCLGTFSLTTPGIGSFWMEIGEDDGAFGGSIALRDSTLCSTLFKVTTSGAIPKVGGGLNVGIAFGWPFVFGGEFLGIGPASDSACLPLASASGSPLMIGITPPFPLIIQTPGLTGGSITLPIPPNCALIGIPLSVQGAGPEFPPTGGIHLTSNTVDFTIGA